MLVAKLHFELLVFYLEAVTTIEFFSEIQTELANLPYFVANLPNSVKIKDILIYQNLNFISFCNALNLY